MFSFKPISTTNYLKNIGNGALGLLLMFMFLLPSVAKAQFDRWHYIPPVYLSTLSGVNGDYYLIVSTNSPNVVNVNVSRSNGVSLANLTVTAGSSTSFLLGSATNPTAPGLSNVVNTAVAGAGIYVTSSEPVMVELRHVFNNNYWSTTSKGRVAMGRRFRTGHLAATTTSLQFNPNHQFSILATEPGTTTVNIDFNPSVTLLPGNTPATNRVITLQQGESYMVAAPASVNVNQNEGLNGTLITSNQDVTVSTGSWVVWNQPAGESGFDQIVPTSSLGDSYVALRGLGSDTIEFTMIVADVNNTAVSQNGTQVATLNAGGMFRVYHSSNVIGHADVITTSQPAYAYQSSGGGNEHDITQLPQASPCVGARKLEIRGWPSRINVNTHAGAQVLLNGVLRTPIQTNISAGGILWDVYSIPTNINNVLDPSTMVLTSTELMHAGLMFGNAGSGGAFGYYTNYDPAPIIAQVNPGNNCAVSLSATPGFVSYTWFLNGAVVQIGPSNTYFATQNGNYNVVGDIGSAGCNLISSDTIPVSGVVGTDTIPPVAICQNVTATIDPNGLATVTAFQVNNGSYDNCTDPNDLILTLDQTMFSCLNVGNNLVTLTVTDGSGNTATCQATVNVVGSGGAPNIQCPGTVTVNSIPGICYAQVTYEAIASACGNVTISYDFPSGSWFPNGLTTVTATATDVNGLTATCSFLVNVLDVTPPMITCPGDIIQPFGGTCYTEVFYDAFAQDDCGPATVTYNPPSGSIFYPGTSTVVATATDAVGNTSTCSFTVTAIDDAGPQALCQNITVTLDPDVTPTAVSITANQVDNGSYDNCGIVSMSVTPSTFGCNQVGQNVVTLTVTDASGLTATCESIVTVLAPGNPVIQCPANIVVNAPAQKCELPVTYTASATDACGNNAMVTFSPASGSVFGPGVTTVTATATDAAGTTTTCSFTVTVIDVSPPTIVCPPTAIQVADPAACGSVMHFSANVTDNCGISSVVYSHPSGSFFPVGITNVTVTATDVNGLTSSCAFAISVLDLYPPVLNCQNISVQLGPNGTYTLNPLEVIDTVYDACGVDRLNVTPSTFTCQNQGTNTVTVRATDANGNSSTCLATVTVTGGLNVDFNTTVSPVSCLRHNFTSVVSGAPGPYTYSWNFGGAIPNTSTAANPLNITYPAFGNYIVTLVVTSPGGCTSTFQDTVTVGQPCSVTNVNFCYNITQLANGSFSVAITNPTATANGNVTYQYSFNGGATYVNTPTRTFTTPGLYNICVRARTTVCGVTCENTCCKEILVNTACNIVASADFSTIAVNRGTGIATFTASTVAGATYQWDFNNDGVTDATTATPSVVNPNPYLPGTYTACVRIVRSADCFKTICRSFVVELPCNVNARLNATFCSNAPLTVTYNATGSTNATAYNWNFGDGTTGTGLNATHTYAQSGTYLVTLQAIGNFPGCSQTIRYNVIVAGCVPTGINTRPADEDGKDPEVIENEMSIDESAYDLNELFPDAPLQLFPNPAAHSTTVLFQLKDAQNTLISLLDLNGRTVWQQNMECVAGENSVIIPVDQLVPGIYYVRLNEGNQMRTAKLSVNR